MQNKGQQQTNDAGIHTRPIVNYVDLGQIGFREAWEYQTEIHKELIRNKRLDEPAVPNHHMIFCEHKHVYTLGRSGSEEHLLLDLIGLEEHGAEYIKINRGGDITYHGPGQLVVYPILDLDHFFNDVHKYVRFLEEAVIRLLVGYGLSGKRITGYTGVWLDAENNKPKRKICAIGVHLSRWVTLHGLALNVETDLSYFNHIVPCGITDEDKTVTSISKELNREIDMTELKSRLRVIMSDLFEFDYAAA